MDSIVDDVVDGEFDEHSVAEPPMGERRGFTPEFDLEVGRVRVEVEDTGECLWMWKVKASDGTTKVSRSVMDAVMGCLEKVTGGEL